MHADRHTSRGVYTMFWTLTVYVYVLKEKYHVLQFNKLIILFMINITDKSQCCGCNACGDVCTHKAITFRTDIEGFWYPEVNKELCIDCGLCEKVCPIINIKRLKRNDYDQPLCYAAIHKNYEVRFESTSGGLFSAFAEKMYRDKGFVGGAIVDTENGGIKQYISSNKNDLEKLRKSKYQQSNFEGFYLKVRDLLKSGEKVLVCGGPCQMAALRAFLNYKEYENLIILDYVCRGINSPLVAKKYGEYLEKKYQSKLVYSKAKNKELGWRTMAAKHKFENGKYIYIPAEKNLFTRGYLHTGVFCRPSCYNCQFKNFPRIADISLADFWGIEEIDKSMDDNVGTSLVLINSEKGKEFFNAISQKIKSSPVPLKKAIKGNKALIESLPFPTINRQNFFEDLNKTDFEAVANKYFPLPQKKSLKCKIIKFLKLWKSVLTCTPFFDLKPKLQFIYYNFLCPQVKANVFEGAYILPHTNVVFDIQKGAQIELKAPLILGFKRTKGSKTETRLLVENGGKMIIDSKICFGYGSDIEIFKGATFKSVNNGIERDSGANMGLTLICGDYIEIGQDVRIGRNVTIRDNNGGHYMSIQGYKNTRPIKIGQHVWLCEACTLMPGSKIGDGAIIGAHSLVSSTIKPFCLVSGNPPQVVQSNVYWKY